MIKKIKCAHCGKEFESTAKHAMYCSQKCYRVVYNARLRAKRAQNKRDSYILTCQCCGKEFNAKKKITKFCSESCKHEAERVKQTKRRRAKRCGYEKIIIEADIYSTWLANFQNLKPNDMLTRKAMIAKALGTTYGQLQSTDDTELRKLEKKAVKVMEREAKKCAKRRKKENGV